MNKQEYLKQRKKAQASVYLMLIAVVTCILAAIFPDMDIVFLKVNLIVIVVAGYLFITAMIWRLKNPGNPNN